MMVTEIVAMVVAQNAILKVVIHAFITSTSLSIVVEGKFEEMEEIMAETYEMMETTMMEMAEAQVVLLKMGMNDLKALQHIVTYE